MNFHYLLEALRHRKDIDLQKVESAYSFAEKAHRGQKRKSGEDYITHPVSVAIRLAELGADEETLLSALLHDTVEDTVVSLADIRHRFGSAVATLVEGMTKFEKHSFDGQAGMDEKIETIRKWLSVMQTDIRIAIIKLTDRIDNLTSLHVFPNPEKRKRIAEETLDVYSKIAEWLSLYAIKYRLEELALPYALDEESYQKFQDSHKAHQEKTAKLCRKVTKAYSLKHPHDKATFKPLTISPLRFSLNPDTPCEIICQVPTEADCYQMLSFFHGHWRQKHGSFADFINTPKVNGYQALHTTIIFDDAVELTVRIMTASMYDYSQNGVLNFCFSDEPAPPLPWIEKLSELLQTNREKSLEFWRGIHSDLFEGFILVHGPQGKVVSLPRRSTYLDAAFAFLKSDAIFVEKILAHGDEIPIRRKIEDGEKIDFVLAEDSQVEYDWLEAVDNVTSIQMIKDALRQQNDSEKIEKGRQLLQQEFNKYNLGFVDEIKEHELLISCQDLKVTSLDDLLIKIGDVSIFPSEITIRLAPKKTHAAGLVKEVKQHYILECEVQRGRFPNFFGLVGGYFTNARTMLQRDRERTFDVSVELDATKEEVNKLIHNIRREPEMRVLNFKEIGSKKWFIIILVAVLWGLDPLFARFLMENAYTSEQLTLVRFFSVVVIMGFTIGIGKRSTNLSVTGKHLPFFDIRLILIGISLFAVAYSSYNALRDTLAMHYNIVISIYVLAIVLMHLNELIKMNRVLHASALAMVVIGYGLLFSDPTWSSEGKLWSVASLLAFGVYYWLSNNYRHNNKILSRYPYFQFYVGIYALIFSLPLLYFVSWENISVWTLLFGGLFTLVFIAVPYLLFPYVHQFSVSIYYDTIRVIISITITFIAQIILLGHEPTALETIALAFVTIGFILFARSDIHKKDPSFSQTPFRSFFFR